MGVDTKLVVYAESRAKAEEGCRAAFDRVAQLEEVMSDYRPTSELMRLCARAGGPAVAISPDLYRVLARAQQVSEESGGEFDVTVGPLVRLWRTSRKSGRLPSSQDLARARSLVGYRHLEFTPPPTPTARLSKPGMLLDLGGIAKGDAGDQALAVLRVHGITRALFQAGGDIVVGDAPPGEAGWSINLPHPPTATPAAGTAQTPLAPVSGSPDESTILVSNRAISTTGDSNQFVEIGGVCYSHVVDPRTGLGMTTRRLVTILAPDGLTSDPLSKTAALLSDSDLRSVIARHPGTVAYRRTLPLGG